MTAFETVLAGIWAENLQLDDVELSSNFFELGGQSIDAIEIISEIKDIFEVSLSLQALNKTPTITELAASLNTTATEEKRLEEIAQLMLSTMDSNLLD